MLICRPWSFHAPSSGEVNAREAASAPHGRVLFWVHLSTTKCFKPFLPNSPFLARISCLGRGISSPPTFSDYLVNSDYTRGKMQELELPLLITTHSSLVGDLCPVPSCAGGIEVSPVLVQRWWPREKQTEFLLWQTFFCGFAWQKKIENKPYIQHLISE